jgi:3-methyl-2-oxobutanoate hydroxymethyltransferase
MKLDAQSLRQMKSVKPIPMLTAYTFPVARCLEKAGIPDHVGAVRRGAPQTAH